MRAEPTTTHATLLARLADAADAPAWEEFQERYGELIRGFAQRRGLQSADCDDVVQDVLLSVARAMRDFTYDRRKGRFRGYLKTATLHSITRFLCQKGRVADLSQVEQTARAAGGSTGIEDTWELEWRAYHVRQAMRVIDMEFSQSDLRAFQRYAVEGQDAQAIAAALGLSVSQVYQAKSRILKRLTQIVERQVEEEG